MKDLHIAAHARSEGLTLVSHNLREFERVDGLLLAGPVAPLPRPLHTHLRLLAVAFAHLRGVIRRGQTGPRCPIGNKLLGRRVAHPAPPARLNLQR